MADKPGFRVIVLASSGQVVLAPDAVLQIDLALPLNTGIAGLEGFPFDRSNPIKEQEQLPVGLNGCANYGELIFDQVHGGDPEDQALQIEVDHVAHDWAQAGSGPNHDCQVLRVYEKWEQDLAPTSSIVVRNAGSAPASVRFVFTGFADAGG
jgi:hypothetical protein